MSTAPGRARLHVLVGTRAQLIKMAPLIRALEERHLPINLLMTGQHQITMAELMADFGLTTPYRLLYEGPEIAGIARMGGWFALCLARLLRARERWFPGGGIAVVHGDTMSTLLGALAARIAGLRVAHVEAGLRSFRLFHPFPEELTRLAVSRLAHVAYCPGPWAAGNLARTGLRVVDTADNTLLDALRGALAQGSGAGDGPAPPYFVASIHRFENVFLAGRFQRILGILESLARRAPCAFVLHPVTEKRLAAIGRLEVLRADPRFRLLPRMSYTRFVRLLAGASFVVTDGGSNQEELSYLGIPTILMRAATERPEGLRGNVCLADYDAAAIEAFLDATPRSAPRAMQAPGPSDAIADDLRAALAAPAAGR